MKASEVIYTNLKTLFKGAIYPLIKPDSEKVYPYLVYTILNTNPEGFIDGYSGHEMAYLQLDIYSYDYDDCEDLTNKLIHKLNDNVKPFFYDNRQYLYEDDTKLFRQSLECHLWQKN